MTLTVVRTLLLAVIAGGFALAVAADDGDWTIEFDEDGLRVETRKVAGSDFKRFRASVFIAAASDAVLARLRDVDSYPDWFPDTTEARRVVRPDESWANYVRTDAPWPVKDRDAIYTQSLSRRGDTLVIQVGVAPELVPEVDDAVRVRQAGGFWELTSRDGGTQVHWEFHLEPGGRIPARMANARVVDTPRRALQALRSYLEPARTPD